MNSPFDKFARVSALRPAMKRARLASSVTDATATPPPLRQRHRAPQPSGESPADSLCHLLGGALHRNHFGEHFVLRRWHPTPEPCPPLNGALTLLDPRAPRLAADPARWLFLDTETTGLAGGTGTYAFLVGLAWWDSAGLQLEQFFLRDFDDEHPMLTALAARLAERPVLVTFNGKSFDWPLLETRYRMTRSIPPPEPAAHLDLLHPARQIWRLRLGSVRLSDLERAVLGAPSSLADWDRSHDVRSDMIPHIYFDYLRGGPITPLLDVFRHNQMDLRGLAAVAVRMAALLDAPESADAPPLDLYGLSRLLRHRARAAGLSPALSGAQRRKGPASLGLDPAPSHACHPERSPAPQRAGRGEGPAFPAQVPINSSASSATSAVKEFAARQLCERALASGLPPGLDRAALRDLASLAKRQRDFPRACSLWHELANVEQTSSLPRAARTDAKGPVPSFPSEDTESAEPNMGMGETMSSSASSATSAVNESPSLDAIHACIELAIHYEHRTRQPERALHFARLALDALRPAARLGLLTPAKAARLRSRLDRRIARLQRKLAESSAPLSELRASALSFSPPQQRPEIARTPLRRASKRALSESNGHAQIPGEVTMATIEMTFLHGQLEDRKKRLQQAIALAPQNNSLATLLREVDSALDRMDKGSYGLCDTCHESVEKDRLLADPLTRYCLDHLSPDQRIALQRDLELAAQVQRKLLPAPDLRLPGWETSYHYSPVGPVSGDYCDLIPSDGHLFFVLGDVSGKGVAASMLMTQLHALFRSLTGMSLPLGRMVAQANRVFCESALAGLYATLVCGQTKPNGEVEIHNAGHWPAVLVGRGGVLRIESTGLPLGMFHDAEFAATRVQLEPGDTLFLYSDGLTEARDSSGAEFGVERVLRLARQHASRGPRNLLAASLDDLRAFSAAAPLLDDLTLLAIRRNL